MAKFSQFRRGVNQKSSKEERITEYTDNHKVEETFEFENSHFQKSGEKLEGKDCEFQTNEAPRRGYSSRITSSSLYDIEKILRIESNQKVCLEALEKAHCAESLLCLLDLFQLEQMESEEEKEKFFSQVMRTYFEADGPKEICVPSEFRTQVTRKMLKPEDIKKLILLDLRFNPLLAEAVHQL